uniref:ERC protein 2 isoform X5 n=1 Tax=Oncorhynchus gorbuscha TaxID=8017 RepID=UPI001EAF7958|nr:ERC protein 2 isoform X5 [Oncorhynchus gorbuscha]
MYGSARAVGHIESSPARSPRLPRSPRLGHRRASSGGGSSGGGKTLSMENIQSLNAAYATSGPMYLSDHEGVGSTATYPKGTMTLGRASNRAMYGGRVTAMGSSPNIATVGLGHHTDLLSYSDLGSLSMLQHHHHHQGVPSALLRQAVRGGGGELLEMQATLRDMQRENDLLKRELDLKDSKLGSSTNSIKSFWSPELKKERMIRKEEAARTSVLKEQMRVTHEENQHLQLTIQALQDELRTQRDLNHLLQESGGRSGEHYTNIELTEENFRRLQAEHDRQAKELFLLRKTLEEMELRMETQKQTLGARDESIKKLLEMLQSKGLPGGPGRVNEEEEQERARRIAEAEAQLGHLEVILDQKEKENIHLREVFSQELHRRNQMHQDPGKTKALQTIIEMKDTKIASLERNIRDLEDEIQILKANGLLNTEDREEEIKQMEVYKNHSKFMKAKIDQLKQELSKKESELLALQTKLETLNNQNSDCKQHIEVLKESLTAKEQRAAILQTEVDALRLRLEEKESFLNKKTKQLQDLTEEKGTLAGEIRDMKDMLEVKERKINVLQKKIENLQEQLCDKDKQLGNLKDRVKSLQTDSSNTDTALATLEEALSEKERIIERLKEQRAREDNERIDEVESYKKENKDLKEKVNTLHMELTEKESCLIDLKEHASSLASSSLKKESKLKSLEMAIEQKKEECSKLETQLQKQAEQLFTQMNNPKAHEVQQQQVGVGSRGNPEYVEREQRVKVLEKEVSYYKEESGKAQAEVDRLLAILREVETEKNDRDKKIAELESLAPRQTKEQVTKKGGPNLKLGPQGEKKPGQIMGDPRKDNTMDLGQHLKLEEMMNTLERTRQELDATKQRLSSTQQSLQERDGHLTNMRQERRKQLEEILEMKQQALLAAISEKDANIALLELSASGKKKTQEEVLALKREKDRLMNQLKQQVRTGDTTQTQSRMKLMADSYEDDHYHPHPPFHSLPQQPHLGLQPQSPQPQYQHPPHPQQQHAPYPHAPHPQPPPQQHPHPQQPQQQYAPHPQQHPQGHPQQPQHQPRPQHPLQVQQPHPQQQHPHPGQHPHGPPPQQQHPHPQQHPQPHLHGPLQQAPHPHHPHPQHPQQHPHHPIPHAPQQQGGHPRHPPPHHRGGPGPARGPPHAGHRPSHDQDDEEGIWA